MTHIWKRLLMVGLCLGVWQDLAAQDPAVQDLAAHDHWPQFRGPDGQGHAGTQTPPTEFGTGQSVKWQTKIPGKGWSSPVVSQGMIWLTSAVAQPATEEERERKLGGDPLADIKEVAGSIEIKAICIDLATGRIVHDISLASFDDPDPINPLNTYASPTPVISENRVYCDFGNYGTWCLDLQTGQTVWTKRILVDYSVGAGSSPIVVDDKLILVCDGIDTQFIIALDKATGKLRWRAPRPPMRTTNVEYQKAYSTPLVIDVAGRSQLVVPGAQWICAYDPSTGSEIWRFDHGDGFSVGTRPIYVAGLVIFTTGYMRSELVALRPDGRGDITPSHQAWRVSRGAPMKPSPIAYGQHIYVIADNGVLTQLNATDGSISWQERLAGNYSASPILAGGKLYFCAHEGFVTVVAPGEDYRELAINELPPRLLASPAAVDEQLLIRSEDVLYCFGE